MHFVQALALTCVLAGGDEKTFDPAKVLADWDACFFSEFSERYHFDAFKGPADRNPTAAEIEKLKKDWDAERARVAKEIERIHSDPRARFAWDIQQTMKRDRFFSSIRYELRPGDSLTVFVQAPTREQPNYVTKVERTYRPYVEQLIQYFEATYTTPAGVARRSEIPSLALVILASRGAYDDYARAQSEGAWPNELAVAHYDPSLRFAITFEQGSAAEFVPEREQRRRVLHESVHALTDAYATAGIAAIRRPWIEEGLAQYLGTTSGEPGNHTLRFGEMDRQILGRVRDAKSVQPFGDIVVPSLAELLAARSYADVVESSAKRASTHGYQLDDEGTALALLTFYDVSYLFVRFLHEEDGGKWRPGIVKYIDAELNGHGGAEMLPACLGVSSLDEIEDSFKKYLEADAKLPDGRPMPQPAPLPPPVAPPTIRLDAAAAGVAQARALALAKAGDVAAAADAMRAAHGDADDVAFLDALLKLSNDVLDEAQKGGKNFVVKGANAAVGAVKHFDAKEIVIVDYKGKETPIPRSAFGPEQIVERVRSKQLSLGTPDTLASALVLTGKSVADAAKGAWASAAPIVKSRAERWAGLQRELDARTKLERIAPLAEGTVPSDPTTALADVDALLGDLRAATSSSQNRAAIVAIGSRLLEREFDRGDAILAAFHGQSKKLANGSVEIRYSLTNPAELSDFAEEREYAWAFVRRQADPKAPTDLLGKWSLEKGTLSSKGLSSLFHVARFAGAASMDYTLTIAGGVDDKAHPSRFVAIAFDDGRRSCCRTDSVIGITEVFNAKTDRHHFGTTKGSETITIGKGYGVKIAHDGAEFVFSVDGTVKDHVADEGVPAGRFGLVASGEFEFDVTNLVVRGTLDPAWIAERRAAWVAERRVRWEK
ncbi:MAG: hypothetical protein HY292_06000 [Planctomycetes bacterium]|nr:hypothetical protein [Planctomycetota bacterium]